MTLAVAETAATGWTPRDALRPAFRDNRSAQYEELVGRYGDRLYATALRILRNHEDACDAVQDAHLQAFRAMDSFEGRSAIYTWLYRITVNASLKRRQQRSRRSLASLDELLGQFADRGCRLEPQWGVRPRSAELAAQEGELRRFVRRAISGLPKSQRTVLRMRDIEELSSRQVADALGITVGAVNVRLHRARAALKKVLEPGLNDGR